MTVSVRLEPMSADRYAGWAAESTAGFADQQVAAGVMPAPEAREYAAGEFDRLLPEGLLTPGHHIWSAYDEDVEVGYLWLRLREHSDGIDAFVLDIAVAPEAQRRGYAHAILLAGEEQARLRDAAAMRLNVFGHNVAARRLYDSLGYQPESTMMTRRLDDASALSLRGGPSVRLEAMRQQQFVAHRALVEPDTARQLPTGLASAGHCFWAAYDGPVDVGLIWLDVTQKSDGLHAFGYDLVVKEDLRGHGYGRAIMAAAEEICRQRGVVSVGLNLCCVDARAQSLCEQMGFSPSATLMSKPLASPR